MDNLLIAILYEDDEEQFDRLQECECISGLRDSSDPFQLEETNFIKLFRVPQHGVLAMLEILGRDQRLHCGDIPPHIKVLCALNFYGQGYYQASVGQDKLLAISQPTVSRCIRLVSKLIVEHLLPIHIKFPTTQNEKELAKQGFQQLGFPDVLGAVDGTHIGIIAPPLSHPTAPGNLFYNRKGFYSINAQVTCGAKGQILNVNPNFPGGTHNSAIWGSSNLNAHLQQEYVNGENNQWLLGDKGYPLVPWLMTPYHVADNVPMQEFNKAHAKAINVVEMCFRKVKNRFRCLHRHQTLHYNPETAATIFLACCALHNMFIEQSWNDDEVLIVEEPIEGIIELQYNNFLTEGRATRDRIAETYFSG